jgi:hypothetical protein
MKEKFKIERVLRLTVRSVREKDGIVLQSRFYDFPEADYAITIGGNDLEGEEELCRLEEWIRRDTICKMRTPADWLAAINQFCLTEELRPWVGAIVWWDFISDRYKTYETEFYEDALVKKYEALEDDWDSELYAVLDALDYPSPHARVYGNDVDWDKFYDTVRGKLKVKAEYRARKISEKLA